MKVKKFRTYVCDFETTVYKGQTDTEVWASACVELFTEDVKIFHSIGEQFDYFKKQGCNICAYYHNLKFDGAFWLSYLLIDLKLKQAYTKLNEQGTDVEWLQEKDMPNNSFKYTISDMGQWYTIIIKTNNHFIEIRDSLKLLPFKVERIGQSFKTKHKKLTMEYEGFRYAGCNITEEEQKYIANDVLVVKEALEIMFTEGHTQLTIGACCLAEFKKIIGKEDYEWMFPDLTEFILTESLYTYSNADAYIRKSYKGGWCYLVKGKENKVFSNGITADVNSLYPSMMSSESGNAYPIGKPMFWKGNFIPDEAKASNKYYFVRIKTRFYIKPNYLPFIQIKGKYFYKGTEALESSDVYDPVTEKYYDHYYDDAGILHDTRLQLTLTMTDFALFKEHYDLVDFEILDGCYFYSAVGIFDEYIEKYKKIKIESTGALRELAKLFLNNLYGKMASSDDSSFKLAFEKDDGSVGFMSIPAHDKKVGYIPIGSAITSYARNFTIRTAQKNYHGKDKAGFIYADTDSIHCDLPAESLKGLTVHDKNFCCWKLEASWDRAIFVRQKTYIEHVTHENQKVIDVPYYNIKCAGMPDKCKELFRLSMEGNKRRIAKLEKGELTDEELEFVTKEKDITNFELGLTVTGKLLPKRIRGGVLLVETTYKMR